MAESPSVPLQRGSVVLENFRNSMGTIVEACLKLHGSVQIQGSAAYNSDLSFSPRFGGVAEDLVMMGVANVCVHNFEEGQKRANRD